MSELVSNGGECKNPRVCSPRTTRDILEVACRGTRCSSQMTSVDVKDVSGESTSIQIRKMFL
jgi:hypothetical protein